MTGVGAGDATSTNRATTNTETCAVKGALEELAIRTADPFKNAELLHREVDAMGRAAATGDGKTVHAHSLTLHGLIIDAANNTTLTKMWRGLADEAPSKATSNQSIKHLDSLTQTHRQLVESIISGDVERACVLARSYQNSLADEAD